MCKISTKHVFVEDIIRYYCGPLEVRSMTDCLYFRGSTTDIVNQDQFWLILSVNYCTTKLTEIITTKGFHDYRVYLVVYVGGDTIEKA